jgi:hypothetical protein
MTWNSLKWRDLLILLMISNPVTRIFPEISSMKEHFPPETIDFTLYLSIVLLYYG